MKRIFVFLSLITIGALADAQTMLAQADKQDSPWVQQAPNGWMLDIDGAGRQERLVLMQTPKGLYFTSTVPCPDGIYTETYSWRHGHKYAVGVSCTGMRVQRPTANWQGWIDPLPFELRSVRGTTHKRSVRTLT